MANGLTPSQLVAISNIERACSALSLIGCLFVIATFCFFDEFHKPINRLVFYASFGNMITNVGTLMSRMYVDSPASAGCQVQSFLIQMFMPADAFWTLAMAINVYLTFYYRFDARGLRKMELPYILCCYGVPFIPALTYLFLKNSKGDMVYGDAVLWCWVTVEWNILRILTFYGPVWILILITFFIYIRAGRTIYQKRKQLDNVISSDADPLSVNREPVGIMKTTEVTTTEASPTEGANAFSLQNTRREGPDGYVGEYAVTVAADGRKPPYLSDEPSMLRVPSTQPPKNASKSRRTANASRRKDYEVNNAAWAYTKCAILFFTALLITWIPSSANRVYSFANPEKTLPPLEFMSAFVLPLQGFWNAIIYMVTSWKACKNMIHGRSQRPAVTELVGGMRGEGNDYYAESSASHFRSPRIVRSGGESESMKGLARSEHSSE